MCQYCEIHIDGVWLHLKQGQEFKTPDKIKSAAFSISLIDGNKIRIEPQGIHISRKSFVASVHYLRIHNHYKDNPCRLDSNNDPALAGPLCMASREANHSVRCINYILPILKSLDIVGLKGDRPNSTWLIC